MSPKIGRRLVPRLFRKCDGVGPVKAAPTRPGCCAGQHPRHRLSRRDAGLLPHPQRRGHRRRHQGRILHGRQFGIIPLAQRNPDSQTVSLILDATTANTSLFAIAAHADEREAHIREVQRYGETLPEGSYGRRNRQAIAARETRVAARLRAVERAYRIAAERNVTYRAPEPIKARRSPEAAVDRETELE